MVAAIRSVTLSTAILDSDGCCGLFQICCSIPFNIWFQDSAKILSFYCIVAYIFCHEGLLLPKGFTDFKTKISICMSMAASIRDVCRENPDRGVDQILSVAICIESCDTTLQAIGLQSLAYLCEADVIELCFVFLHFCPQDFYSAWDVIGKHVLDYSTDSTVAHGWHDFVYKYDILGVTKLDVCGCGKLGIVDEECTVWVGVWSTSSSFEIRPFF
ncbi:Focadhesin/RST, DUF3730 [Dillenia turbinata]|uniref:Focadhesin/RST, DUF3730 n=1 Tax=Dillenia turbinata TaxID=194707 RepID=A0AAN8WIL7_9MAGN